MFQLFFWFIYYIILSRKCMLFVEQSEYLQYIMLKFANLLCLKVIVHINHICRKYLRKVYSRNRRAIDQVIKKRSEYIWWKEGNATIIFRRVCTFYFTDSEDFIIRCYCHTLQNIFLLINTYKIFFTKNIVLHTIYYHKLCVNIIYK